MVNKVILVGRLGQDPQSRFTGGGLAVCNFSMATDETFKDRNGEKQKRTEWHKIVAWGKLSEIITQYCVKGQLVYIEGRLQTRDWQDKEGQKRTTTEIVADTMRMLGGGKGRQQDADPNEQPSGQSAARPGRAPEPEISDEDIPF